MIWKKLIASFNNSLGKKMLIICIGATTLSFIIVIFTNYVITQRSIQRLVTQQLQMSAESLHAIVAMTLMNGSPDRDEAPDTADAREKKINRMKNFIRTYIPGGHGYAYIVNTEGTFVAHPTAEGENNIDDAFIQTVINDKKGTLCHTSGGKKTISAFIYIKSLDWHIVAETSIDDFFSVSMLPLKASSILLTVFFSALLSILFYRLISILAITPIGLAEKAARSISEGRLDIELACDENRKDEIGLLMKGMAEMIAIMRNMFATLSEHKARLAVSSGMMDEISKKISSMSQNQAASMEESSAALEQTLATMEQIAAKAEDQYQRVDKNAGRMANMANEAQNSLNGAMHVSEIMTKTIQEARAGEVDLNRMVEEMQNIKSSTSKIAEIIKIISDISEQVNLLSLNAAIEAARAGDHGRGFAVVADEISKLAEETASSAKNITNLVKAGNQQVDTGTKIVDRTASTFHHIIELVDTISGSMGNFSETLKLLAGTASEARERTSGIKQISRDVSDATQEQMMTNREISKTLEKINESYQELVGYAESIRKASLEIGTISSEVESLMSRFRQ
jgi:methyl-accepting chemotaxis protein